MFLCLRYQRRKLSLQVGGIWFHGWGRLKLGLEQCWRFTRMENTGWGIFRKSHIVTGTKPVMSFSCLKFFSVFQLCFLNLNVYTIKLLNDSDSMGLQWCLRFCISNKFSAATARPQIKLWEIRIYTGSASRANYSPWTKSSPLPLFKHSFIGTQAHPFVYLLSVTACALQWQHYMVVTETM